MNIPQGSEFETESAQAALGAQPPLPNISPDSDINIPIVGGYFKGGGATSNDDEVFENNLLQDLNAFKSLKVGGAGNSLSLRKRKEYYAYKLKKVLSDGTATAAKKEEGGTDVSARYLYLYAKDKVAKNLSWGSAVLAHMYYNLGAVSRDDGRQFAYCTTLLEHHELASISPNTHRTMQTRGGSGSFDQQITALNDQLQKLEEDKEKESEANINLRKALKEKTSECDLLKETIEQMKEKIKLKRVVDDVKRESLKVVNTLLIEQIDLQIPSTIPLAVLQSHQPVPDTTQAKKYEDLLVAHEDVKKKLIAKEDFREKLVNAKERMKSLEANNSEWVWRQTLKKALVSKGMGDMGDPTFEELFEQNERLFTIAQQGPKGDYQKDLVSTAVTLKNVIITRREKMVKKKKIQELLFQPWTKYPVDVRGVEISDNNYGFRVTTAIQHQSQHRFPYIMKSLKIFLCKDPAF
ncbi:hypothetical protein GIB67_016636 [Kingdonia uniflora]|uniref:Uncharacterized protein n=1 Tax=Kingdonia uniflora TaxID=39325 RepID=A0A7J7MZK2_9MAGN|nr:hypothetical protein GIB67_016636 [Kingdonia uniflora]